MNVQCNLLRRARITALVFIVPMLMAAISLRAGEIHDAAAAGDLEKVKALLEADPTLLESKDDRREYKGNTPLISACWGPGSNNWQATVASFLIDKGADINARNDRDATPLYFSTKDIDLIRRLIAKGANVNIRAYGDYTPLHQCKDLGVAKLLLDHGANPNASGAEGTPLHFIIRMNRASEEMIKLLVEGGARVNEEFSLGDTALHLAVLKGAADLIPILVKYGADVNAVNDNGRTPLYYAAKHGYRQTADALIAAGANQGAIAEANYGKAPQLTAPLKKGEAYLWFLGGGVSPSTGYAVKTREHLLIFDPPEIDDSVEAGLANGHLNPNELAGQRITMLFTRPNGLPGTTVYPRSAYGPSVSKLAKRIPGADFVLCFNPAEDKGEDEDARVIPPYPQATPHESLSVGAIRVHVIPALLQAFIERGPNKGLGYLVEADGVKVFHAGLHAASNNDASHLEKYRKEIDFLKPFGPIDLAILPVGGGGHLTVAYPPYLYLVDQLSPKAVYLIGDRVATEEHKKCVDVLRARNVPVAYPEGGIAVGERFHYLRDQASATATAPASAIKLLQETKP